jgi:undecaprenyl-diphosphatase
MFCSLLERIVELDTYLFFLLNSKAQNAVLDFLMPILTNLDYWRVPIALLAIALLVFGRKRGRIAVLLLILGITLSDQVCNNVFKPLVGRVRPCNVLDNVHLLINCTRSFSFPSSHATNIFTGMIIFSFVYPRLRIGLLVTAAMVAYSRVYVGVHYPFDILAGAALGVACAITVITIYKILSGVLPGIRYAEETGKDRDKAHSG